MFAIRYEGEIIGMHETLEEAKAAVLMIEEEDRLDGCYEEDCYEITGEGVTVVFRVYGVDGHRQKESFCDSYRYDFSDEDGIRILDVRCFDKTGTHEYTEVAVTRPTVGECYAEIEGQITDGIFENQRTGKCETVGIEKS